MPPDLTTCGGGGKSGSGGGEGGSSIPEIRDGETPVLEGLYLYWPTCTGKATFSLCTDGEKPEVSKAWMLVYDGTKFVTLACAADDDCLECAAKETIGVTMGKEIYLLVVAEEGVEDLGDLTLSVTCE